MVIPALDEYAQWLMAGLAPTWYYALWSSGMLIPLVKKEPAVPGGTPDVRPIVCGEAERRALERTRARELEDAFATTLTPQQVAVGVDGGPSVLVLGIQLALRHRPDFVCVKMDMKNGYNAVRRAAALRALRGQPRGPHVGTIS